MTSRRQRQWLNEFNSPTVSASGQDSFTLATTGFDKGETVVRELLSVTARQVTANVVQAVAVAIWVGQFGGILTDLFADSPESYMLWDGWEQVKSSVGGPQQEYRTYDLRGQRASRSDSENVHFVAACGPGSDVVFTVFSRILLLLP